MTPLTKIENGILSGDWQLVCDGFNKITGKSLSPPIVEPVKQVFNPDKASKKELYNYIKENINPSIGAMKSFSIEELREILIIYGSESAFDYQEEVTKLPTKTNVRPKKVKIDPAQKGFLNDGRYFMPTKLYGNTKMLDEDVKPLHLVEDPILKKIVEPDDFEHNPRNPPRTVEAKCVRCGIQYKTLAGLTVSDEEDPDLRGNCPKCQESFR